jgi:hypothetical protein
MHLNTDSALTRDDPRVVIAVGVVVGIKTCRSRCCGVGVMLVAVLVLVMVVVISYPLI